MDSPIVERGPIAQLLKGLHEEYGEKAAKYLAVTVVNVVVGQGLLIVCSAGLGWAFLPSNVVAVSLSAIPAFILYRRWVWGRGGKAHLTREVLPFWGLALLGLVFSSIVVTITNNYSDRTIVLLISNLMAFGILWVLKFFFLDKMLFDISDAIVHDEDVGTAP